MGVRIPKDTDNSTSPTLGPDLSKDFFLVISAICHQTTPLVGLPLQGESRAKKLRGLDYLKDRFEAAIEADHNLLLPGRLATFTSNHIVEIVADGKGGGHITDPQGRAELLRNVGEVMTTIGWKNAEDIYLDSGGYLKRADGSGLLANLSQMEAFKDPLQNKSFYYLSIMRNNGLWTFKDPEHLGSPVDYHVIRGFLRLGIVKISGSSLTKKLVAREPVSEAEDLAIRSTIYKAVEHISHGANVPSEEMYHLFWNVFRNCCSRETPHYDACPPKCKLPKRYKDIKIGKYIFADVFDRRTELLEPNCITNWY